jgi:hypothetical protein
MMTKVENITEEELLHLHRRRLTKELWKDFSPVKQSMEWYKHNKTTLSPFVIDYYKTRPHLATTMFSTGFSTEFSTIQKH